MKLSNTKQDIKRQILFFWIMCICALFPFALIVNAGIELIKLYFNGNGYPILPYDPIALLMAFLAFFGAFLMLFFLYRAWRQVQKQWQNQRNMEDEALRIHHLLERQSLENLMDETAAKEKLKCI